MNIVKVDEEQDVLIAKVGWDGKPSCEVGNQPTTHCDGRCGHERKRREMKTGCPQDEG